MEAETQHEEHVDGGAEQRVPLGLVFVTGGGLLLAVALALIPMWLKDVDRNGEVTVWQEIIGDFHPVVLHLPIGIFMLIFAMEVCGWLSFGRWKPQTTFPLFVGVVTAAVAVIAGNFLHLQGVNSDDSIADHLWGSTVFSILAIMSYLTKIWADQVKAKSPIYPIFLVVTIGTLGFATHAGGGLIWGDPFEKPIALLFGGEEEKDGEGGQANVKVGKTAEPAKPAAERLVYKEVIVPILRSKCYECHADAADNPTGKKRIKGKLLMTSIEALKKGGSEDAAAVPGDAEHSLMIERIKLPLDDDDHMPPEDKPQIEPHELKILEWWIKAELPEGKTLKDAGAPEDIIEAAEQLKSDGQLKEEQASKVAEKNAKEEAAAARRKALEGAVAEVSKHFPNALGFISQQDSELTFTAVSMRGDFKDGDLSKLLPVGDGLVDLNLGATAITDKGAETLGKMPRLRKLWLNGTQVTDQGLDALSGLKDLEYLNLYGTQVTDEGLKKLSGLENLKNLYLWQTKVTPAAVEEFKKSVPGCEINLGVAVN